MLDRELIHLKAERAVLLDIIVRLADIGSVPVDEARMLKEYALALEASRQQADKLRQAEDIAMIQAWLAKRDLCTGRVTKLEESSYP